jgi:hypothetical protein
MTLPDEPLQQKMHNLPEFEHATVVGEANKYAPNISRVELHVGKCHNLYHLDEIFIADMTEMYEEKFVYIFTRTVK